ncbi:hypothetical protein GZH53_16170 [Flavihumibacter sp. R14]|nr:hypothetical protein [Flavihumibacter soli]
MAKLFLILLAAVVISCNNPLKNKNNSDENTQTVNKVIEPENLKLFEVPAELREISGISFLDNDIVLAIQDEKGILYQYDIKNEKILHEFEFGEPDDYEDVVRVDKDVYIVMSNGTIIQVKNFLSEKPQVTKFKTALTKDNDIEGLGYEPQKKRLLLAAKADGMDKDENTKEIYGFSLATMTLDSTPAYSIRLNEIESYFKGDALEESSKKFLKALGNRNINKVFRPSAVTVEPKTNKILVLSSINNLIAVLTPDGKISEIIQFEGKDYKQPEGLAFSDNGSLFVSNEAGKNGKGNIIELKYAN